MEVGRPGAIRAIARARSRISPPVPEYLQNWIEVFNSEEWGPRLRYTNTTTVPFYQGPLEILCEDGHIRFIGIVFTNYEFLEEMNVHLRSVRTICMDGTFQVRPRQPTDINQLFTVQIIFNDIVSFIHINMLHKHITISTFKI